MVPNKSAIGTKVEVFAGANRQKFERNFVTELHVTRGDDRSHATERDHTFDAVTSREDVTFSNRRLGIVGHWTHTMPLIQALAYGSWTMRATSRAR